MGKKKSLAAALQQASAKEDPKVDQDEEKQDSQPPPSRQGKKLIGGHFDPVVSRQVKQIALDNDLTVQEVLREALNDLFEKYNKQRIA